MPAANTSFFAGVLPSPNEGFAGSFAEGIPASDVQCHLRGSLRAIAPQKSIYSVQLLSLSNVWFPGKFNLYGADYLLVVHASVLKAAQEAWKSIHHSIRRLWRAPRAVKTQKLVRGEPTPKLCS
jgi:hypothetical protein